MKKLKHILCPVDFSPVSESTVKAAGNMALKLGANVTLIHVVSVIPASYGALYGIDFQAIDTVELINSSTKALEEVRAKYIPAGVSCHIVSITGNVASEVIAEVKKSEVDLIVMATSGAHGVEEFLIGSNAAKISRSAPCAVLTLREPENWMPSGKILIPLDISLGLKALRDFLGSYIVYDNFEAELLVISEPGYKDPHPNATQIFMEKQIEALNAYGIQKVTWKEVFSDDIVETICNYAEENQFGMIMMKSEGRSSFAKFILGSNTEGVINHSKVPVLTVRIDPRDSKARFTGSMIPSPW
jgi:nucleotide-binding universal stress UspA family protein